MSSNLFMQVKINISTILSSCASQPLHLKKKKKKNSRCFSSWDFALLWPGLNVQSAKRFFKARLDGDPALGVPANSKGIGTR